MIAFVSGLVCGGVVVGVCISYLMLLIAKSMSGR